jgi:hypothetical protein
MAAIVFPVPLGVKKSDVTPRPNCNYSPPESRKIDPLDSRICLSPNGPL